ncbi:ABC transporter ATP-binding protein/permease [Acuticoccus mangrovi]|uniref:ATP-binding cassette domain-containing protein n=1 Tax=Acuticoccus mangrovi TaxID=2796142 RepID=A0A934IFU7_9HYPH|nr:ATP-binding cassette domain-containing protein [Acuticoccus mangrovi]MBJ3775879.1 ATP-binding cassette domain-containing protein [Acuticoccus mangrovi]
MTETTAPPREVRKQTTDRILGPVAAELRRSAYLSVAAGLMWPLQAAVLAWIVAGWVEGATDLGRTALGALGFVAGGAVRAALERLAGADAFAAADRVVERERATLLTREARATGPMGSAAVAALATQKLPMIQPFITRYTTAMTRVRVVPLVLLLLTLWLSWAVALIFLVAGPLIPVFMALVGMAASEASRRQMEEIGSMNDMLIDRLAALTDIRLLGASERAAADFAARAEGLRERTMAVLRIAFLSSTVLELFAAIGVAMVAVFVGFSLLGVIGFGAWGTPLTLAEGLFLLLIAPEFFQPMRDLAAAWHDRAAGLAVAEELIALDEAPRVPLIGRAVPAAPMAGPLRVRLDDAVAALPGLAVRLPRLDLSAGEAVVLSGPSGSGKSTTLAAVAGLVPLASGRLEVCGAPLGDANADAWRARLAVVPQRLHFAAEPLAAFLDPRGTGADPWPALDLARARDVVARLPGGLDARLGETGGGVSGGEARRLAVARAVMAGGDLVLADEPTADLDAETARQVIDALLALRDEGRALLVATHDPALVAALERTVRLPA